MSYREIFNKQLNRPVLTPQLKQELKQSILEDVSAFLSNKKNMRETISELLHKQKQKEIENNYNRLLQYERKYLKTYTYINRPEQEIYSYWYKRWFERRYNNYKDKLKPKDYSLPKKEARLGSFIQETPITFGFEDEIIFNFADDDIVFNFE
jgi:sulfur relay (sulfurtransferase) DsrC/TusE family protein